MQIPATITSKGQITIPVEVRKALGLQAGDRVMFRLADGHAVIRPEDDRGQEACSFELEKLPAFFDLAGSVAVPDDVDPADWPAQREAAWISAVRDRR